MAAILVIVGSLLSVAATGQVNDSATIGPDPELQEIMVTGSRIRRTNAETPSPVQLISSADLKHSGYTTIAEVLQNITANGQGTLSNANPGAAAGSASGISLRGLNTSATLVLIDGHRMAPFPLSDDGQRSFVDLSSIPFDVVERIEVLKDGASAVYGSDAIAGVVNIILKKAVTGTIVSADAGTTTEGGGTTEHATVTHGIGDLESDGYNAYVNLEYRHQDSILQSQRQGDGLWSSLNQTSIGGITQVPGVVSPISPIPPAYGTVYLTPLTGAYSAANSYFYSKPISPNSAYTGSCTYALQQAGSCAFTNPHAEIQPTTQNINLLASMEKKLGDDWLLGFKASVFDSRGQQYINYSSSDGLSLFPTRFSPLVAVSANVLPHLVGNTIRAVTVPATYPENPFGAPAQVRGVSLDAPARHRDFNSESYRVVTNLTGTLGGWNLDTSVGYTRINTTSNYYGQPNVPALFAALNRPMDPFLITGGNSATDIATIYPSDSATDKSTLAFAEFNAARSLAKLVGGDLGLSTGAQIIYRNLDAPAPPLVAEGIVAGNNAYVQGSQSDTAAYAEIAAPVVKMLELDGHVRFDHFDNAGNSTTPSAGFKFTPIQQLSLRGTYGKGFRAPNAAENGKAGNAFGAGTSNDPILCPDGNPTTKGNVISQCSFGLIFENSANPNIKPEKSTSETLGMIFEPFKAWTSTLDYYQVTIKDQIVFGTGNINNAVRGAPVSDTCSNGAGGAVPCTTSVGEIIYIPIEYVNANSTEVKGLELTSRYTMDLDHWGSITTQFDWSHMMSYLYTVGGITYQLAGTHGPAVIGGDTGNPKDRIQGSLEFNDGPLQIRTTFNWIGSFSLTDPSGSAAGMPVLTCADGVQNGGGFASWFLTGQPTNSKYCRVQSFLDTDIWAGYTFGKNWSVHGSISNVFNSQPPLDLATSGGGILPYNPSLHQAGAVGRFINLGFIFKM